MKWLKKKVEKYLLNRDVKEVGQKRVKKILDNQLPKHETFFLDGKYRIPSYEKLKKVIQGTTVEQLEYRVNPSFDCENFSFYFQSILALDYSINACGIVISYASKHGFNILLANQNDTVRVFKFEPQNDRIWRPRENEEEKYIIENQIILI